MDTNIIYALVVAPFLVGGIIWLVIYSRRQHEKNILQTSIKSQESGFARGHAHDDPRQRATISSEPQ